MGVTRSRPLGRRITSVTACAGLLVVASPVVAQGVRGWAGTTVQAVDVRRFGPVDGCLQGPGCYQPLADRLSVVGTQDVSLTAWGFGVQGLSATVYLRGRAGLGDGAVWPRSDDHFDAILAYAQWSRSGGTVRLGRQEIRSGLGFASFDGLSAAWRFGGLRVEGFGGRSLARGLRDPADEARRGIEDFLPDQGVYLFGGSAAVRTGLSTLTGRYQREILADRSGLASERAAVDGTTSLSLVRVTGGVDWDIGIGRVGKAHLTASRPLRSGRWLLSATARRYVPYFSLSTIWGFFEPVAYHEAVARVAWSATPRLGVRLGGGWRQYGDADVVAVLRPLEDTGWRAEAGVSWTVSPTWGAEGRSSVEWGPGGFLSSLDATARWTPTSALSVGLSAMSLQQIEQFRVGDGRAFGAGVNASADVTSRLTVVGGVSVLRHTARDDGIESPWNQRRLWTSVRLALGEDPGLSARRRR